KQSYGERKRRIDGAEADRLALALGRALELAGLHDRRVQIKIVWHHRRAQDSDRDIQHPWVTDDLRRRHYESAQQARHAGMREENLQSEADSDHTDQRNHERFDEAESLLL